MLVERRRSPFLGSRPFTRRSISCTTSGAVSTVRRSALCLCRLPPPPSILLRLPLSPQCRRRRCRLSLRPITHPPPRPPSHRSRPACHPIRRPCSQRTDKQTCTTWTGEDNNSSSREDNITARTRSTPHPTLHCTTLPPHTSHHTSITPQLSSAIPLKSFSSGVVH